MKNVIKNIKDSKGFVSLETIIIAGAIIILGGVILYFFNGNAEKMTNSSGTQMDSAQTKIQGDGKAPTGVDITNANVGTGN